MRIGLRAGDLDADGDVELSDLVLLLSSFNICEGKPGFVPVADITRDGCVDVADLAALLGNFGEGL